MYNPQLAAHHHPHAPPPRVYGAMESHVPQPTQTHGIVHQDYINGNPNGWLVQWRQQKKDDWMIQIPMIKECKKRKDSYTSVFDDVYYKSPYKYHINLVCNGMKLDEQVFVQLALNFENGESIQHGDMKVLSNGPRELKVQKFEKTQFNQSASEVTLGPFQFNVCSFRQDGRKFRVVLHLFSSILSIPQLVCSVISPPFTIRAKKPIKNPGTRKRKRKNINQDSSTTKTRKRRKPNTTSSNTSNNISTNHHLVVPPPLHHPQAHIQQQLQQQFVPPQLTHLGSATSMNTVNEVRGIEINIPSSTATTSSTNQHVVQPPPQITVPHMSRNTSNNTNSNKKTTTLTEHLKNSEVSNISGNSDSFMMSFPLPPTSSSTNDGNNFSNNIPLVKVEQSSSSGGPSQQQEQQQQLIVPPPIMDPMILETRNDSSNNLNSARSFVSNFGGSSGFSPKFGGVIDYNDFLISEQEEPDEEGNKGKDLIHRIVNDFKSMVSDKRVDLIIRLLEISYPHEKEYVRSVFFSDNESGKYGDNDGGGSGFGSIEKLIKDDDMNV